MGRAHHAGCNVALIDRRFPFGALLVAFAVAGAAAPAQAQFEMDKHRRSGMWFSLGLGGGWNLSNSVNGESKSGFAGYIRAGGSLSPHLLLGGEMEWWYRDETDDLSLSSGNFTLVGLYYPSLDLGGFVKLGVGVAAAEIITAGGSQSTWESGAGVTAGVGWDVPVGQKISLTANADFLFQRVAGFNNTLLLFTLGVTF